MSMACVWGLINRAFIDESPNNHWMMIVKAKPRIFKGE